MPFGLIQLFENGQWISGNWMPLSEAEMLASEMIKASQCPLIMWRWGMYPGQEPEPFPAITCGVTFA